jgi:hypothetical protein
MITRLMYSEKAVVASCLMLLTTDMQGTRSLCTVHCPSGMNPASPVSSPKERQLATSVRTATFLDAAMAAAVVAATPPISS